MDERELQMLLDKRSVHMPSWAPCSEVPKPTIRPSQRVRKSATVSLIVPTFHNARLKQNSLLHVLANVEDSESVREVIVAVGDDRKDDYARLRKVAGGKRVVTIDVEENERGKARNLAAARASGRYLLFLDDDMVCQDWRVIDVILSALLTGKYDAALFPRRSYMRFPLLLDESGLSSAIGRWRRGELNGHRAFYDPYVHGTDFRTLAFCFPGCFMLISRSAFRRLGGFREEYSGWGFEDAHFAVDAIERLKVLNLFNKVEPLLHIDHPVTPYKPQEHERNYAMFLTATGVPDLDVISNRVFTGRDYDGRAKRSRPRSALLSLPTMLRREHGIRLRQKEVMAACERILEQRTEAGAEAEPKQVVLFGSKAGRGVPAEDGRELLVLFGGAPIKEFFVSWNGSARVELEFSSHSVFDEISRHPDHYGLRGLREIVKIAGARWLRGDQAEWTAWRRHLIDVACLNGRAYWMAHLLGVNLVSGESFEELREQLLALLTEFTLPEDLPFLANFEVQAFAGRLTHLLEGQFPTWAKDTAKARKVFASQPSEVWRAMQWLVGAR